jgi:predicted nuclease of restriction endonuclease-like (RecB) superfamily
MNNFKSLSSSILSLHSSLHRAAAQSVNRTLTIRNWLIGRHIVEYEQNGEDRAEYGTKLLEQLSNILKHDGVKGMSVTALRNFRQFYSMYNRLSETINQTAGLISGGEIKIHQMPSDEFEASGDKVIKELSPGPDLLLKYFSFSHFVELIRISDPLKRLFYELEGIRGSWSVAQLKRQIESLLYERTGLSGDKAGLVKAIHAQKKQLSVDDILRDPYILEFTGFPEKYQFSENDLETALLDHIQSFLLELGNGFCFEARQMRITLDNEHDRIDLVFYHRMLRCHVLIDLKVGKFTPGDAGQMNYYLNYFRDNIMTEGDNPPVGLILCSDRDETRVKYATSGLDNRLFVSKYLTCLPSENSIRQFLADGRERIVLKLNEECAKYGDYF